MRVCGFHRVAVTLTILGRCFCSFLQHFGSAWPFLGLPVLCPCFIYLFLVEGRTTSGNAQCLLFLALHSGITPDGTLKTTWDTEDQIRVGQCNALLPYQLLQHLYCALESSVACESGRIEVLL